MSFIGFASYQKLAELAKEPIDLRIQLTSDRLKKYQAEALGFKLLYGCERVSSEVLGQLLALAKESKAIEQMIKMQSGEVVNTIEGFPCENRAALHTAMRDFFDHRMDTPKAKEASQKAFAELEKLKSFLPTVDKFSTIVQVGIGGSDLGPRALYLALEAYRKKGRKAHFISNVDPDDAYEVLEKVDLDKTVFVVVSKSGTTLETLTNEYLIRDFLQKKGINPKERIISVTGEKSPMDDSSNYLASFYIWDYIGGRYSATSMVGAVLLGFCFGIEPLFDFLFGASQMDKHVMDSKIEDNLPLISALLGIWNRNFLKLPTLAILPYSQALVRFVAHLQQLDMESNGKSIDKQGKQVAFETGPVIWGEVGTNGQHSFYQSIHQGSSVIPSVFIGFAESVKGLDIKYDQTTSHQKLLANLFAQVIALAKGKSEPNNLNQNFEGNRPSHLLLAKKLDFKSLGTLLAFFEHRVAFQGFIWNINSFDQEGVQLGKKLANQIIDLYAGKDNVFEEGKFFIKELKKL